MKKIPFLFALLLTITLLFTGCATKVKTTENATTVTQPSEAVDVGHYDNDDDGEEIDVLPNQTISEDGKYVITGEIDGQVLVTAENVTLILDGANINCSDASAILGKDGNGSDIAQNLTIELRGENTVTSGSKHGIQGKDNLTITGTGSVNISAEKDGLHAGETLTVKDGIVNVIKSFEGMEATNIVISGGSSTINSTDDGINATIDVGETETPSIDISGGEVVLYSTSDGIDSNGTLNVTDGTIAIFIGATRDGDGTDVDRGGTILPALYGTASISAGSEIEVDGLWSFTPTSNVTSFCLMLPGLANGKTYQISVNERALMSVTATTTIQGMMMGGGNLRNAPKPDIITTI
ncbi:MAG: carbohydrate-binding domain-containing protein [Clostridiales Family XIII bacterium]|jgi:hypothetical protein|nr:carbohydrate-binding domain-containing protein [Clostridiales Family XIII bacterium]